jgi:hypothetical protein
MLVMAAGFDGAALALLEPHEAAVKTRAASPAKSRHARRWGQVALRDRVDLQVILIYLVPGMFRQYQSRSLGREWL